MGKDILFYYYFGVCIYCQIWDIIISHLIFNFVRTHWIPWNIFGMLILILDLNLSSQLISSPVSYIQVELWIFFFVICWMKWHHKSDLFLFISCIHTESQCQRRHRGSCQNSNWSALDMNTALHTKQRLINLFGLNHAQILEFFVL